MKKTLTIHLLIFSFFGAFLIEASAQNGINKEKFRLGIQRAVDEIKIDGLLDEQSWAKADTTSPFTNKWPTDEGMPPLQTKIRLTYDDNFLYVAATCYEDSPDYIIQSLKRDASVWSSDGIMVILDPVNQQSNGFAFFTNALGVQTEGLIAAGSSDGISDDWDNKWFVKTAQQANGDWTAEFAIPFKTLRFDSSLDEWGVNFLRCDVGNNMYSTWSFVPLQFNGPDLSYAGTLKWDAPPPEVKSNFSIIPYITGGVVKDIDENNFDPTSSFDAGLDAKVAVTSSLNLDLTVNPDFSQIEVDAQQTNLTRFNLFFPEKRTFFLENSDIFTGFGIPPVRPFFSRRIGLDDDGNAIPILFGARLSGNVSEGTRIGAMTMQTAETDTQSGQNFSVAAFNQRVLSRSTIKGIAINRQGFTDGEFNGKDYSRNLGGEFNYSTPDGNLVAWAGYHGSFTPEKYDDSGFTNAGVFYGNRNFETLQDFAYIGDNYITDAGFIRRLDNYDAARDTTVRIGYSQIFQTFKYRILPTKADRLINFHRLKADVFNAWSNGYGRTTTDIDVGYSAFLMSTAEIEIGGKYSEEFLPFETDLLGEDFDFLPSAWYKTLSGSVSYESNSRKLFSYELEANYGQFFNGTLAQFEVELKYRIQPRINFQLAAERNIVNLPDNYGTAKLWLISPRIAVNFSKNIFWTTFLQYNTQSDDFNINSRLQWRYRPMSDLFLVYTDNYLAENFGLQSRAVVLKFNYWLTI